MYRVPALQSIPWLEHGFGTRSSENWPESSRLATLKQIHSAQIHIAHRSGGRIGEGDALLTGERDLLVGVRTADCVPILLVDTRLRAVAAIHAGWRGSAQAITSRTLSALQDHFGTATRDVFAAIGPSIGACCYQVGADVAAQFTPWHPELDGVGEPVRIDLAEINARQLVEAGVLPDRIYKNPPCTQCCAETLHSYRRDKEAAGRMISAIGIREENEL